MPDPEKEYEVVADASDTALGAILLQEGHPIAYASKKMIPAELNYSPTEKSCWHRYLLYNFGGVT